MSWTFTRPTTASTGSPVLRTNVSPPSKSTGRSSMGTIRLPQDFKEFLRLLEEEKAEYLVVGGYAVGYYGYPRVTAGLDVWIPVEPKGAVFRWAEAPSRLQRSGNVRAGCSYRSMRNLNRVLASSETRQPGVEPSAEKHDRHRLAGEGVSGNRLFRGDSYASRRSSHCQALSPLQRWSCGWASRAMRSSAPAAL